MQRLEVSGAVRPIYGSLGVKRLKDFTLNGIVLVPFVYIMGTLCTSAIVSEETSVERTQKIS